MTEETKQELRTKLAELVDAADQIAKALGMTVSVVDRKDKFALDHAAELRRRQASLAAAEGNGLPAIFH